MLSALLLLLSQTPAETPAAVVPPAEVVAPVAPPAPPPEPVGCDRGRSPALGEGPIALGYAEADTATGRRVCPRTEAGIGGRFGAIIDKPNFYGNLVVDGVVFGSVRIDSKTEIFGTLDAFEFNEVITALTAATPTLGTLTLGATRQFYGDALFLGALSARLILPTSFVNQNTRLFGAEAGHASTWRPRQWIEVHSYLGADFTAGLGLGPALPRVGGILSAGAQVSPFTWAAVVLDVTGRLGPTSYLAPTLGLRFRVSSLGIELAGTLPLVGSDRHDFVMGARFSWRLGGS